MADGGDRLAGVHGVAREIHHRVAHAHAIGCVAAGDHERVEVGDARRAGRHVRRHRRIAAFAAVRCAFDGATIVTVAPAARSTLSGPVNSKSSNSSSTRIATRLPWRHRWGLYPKGGSDFRGIQISLRSALDEL